jgi:hypothetical protein
MNKALIWTAGIALLGLLAGVALAGRKAATPAATTV